MTKINIFDRTLKIIARNYTDTLLELIFPDVPVRLLGTLENVELSLPVRPVDFVHRVEYDGTEYILHLEFQFEHKAGFPRRTCICHGALTEQFGLPVMSLALYLKPRQTPIPNEYVVRLSGRVINRFTYPVVKLWDYVQEIRSGQYRGLAPLLITLVPDPDESVLREERTLIRDEPDDRKRADLFATAVTIASRYFDKTFLWRFFREELELMREATFVEEWILEGIEQGVEQGVEQGIEQGLQIGQVQGAQHAHRDNILQTLRARFRLSQQEEKPLVEQLETIDSLNDLKDLFEHALMDITMTDFSTRLDDKTNGRHR